MIKGKLVELRAVEREDLPRYVEWFNDPDTMRYLGRYEPMTIEQEEEWYERQLEKTDVRNFAVYYQGEHVGGAGYIDLDLKQRSAEVGIVIGRKDLWSRGLGFDTLHTLLDFGFGTLNLHRICLRVFAEHKHAIGVYERVGFQHEGRMREAAYRHGRLHDMLLMSILEQDYRCTPAAG